MPTGYTAGIIDGKITTFREFAKTCMKAFGATIHMRDETLDTEYVPREINEYYRQSLDKWKQTLDEVIKMSDEEIIAKREKELQERIDYARSKMDLCERNCVVLGKMLEEVHDWEPPTEEHKGFKKFMLEQLNETIKHDCDTSYYRESLSKSYNEMFSIDAKKIREEYIKDAKYNINYSQENLDKEVKRVEESNKWVEQLLNSI